MTEPRQAKPTVKFVDDYCQWYESLFPEVRSERSFTEQARIIECVDTYDTRIRAEEAYRDKLKLQKQGLMHDLLTGKVHIKNA